MILASAIKYETKQDKKIVILCGARHGDIFKQVEILGRKDLTLLEEGFIDHENNFLTRSEAFYHGKMCGQIAQKIIDERENKNIFGTELISEDLW